MASVNSSLQRARATLRAAGPVLEDFANRPTPERAVLERYLEAFETADVAGLTRLLADDVVLEMPPVLNWYVGPEQYGRFMDRVFALRGPRWQAVALSANGQPALAAYVRSDDDGRFHAHSLQVFTARDGSFSHNVVFADTTLFPAFGLPAVR